MKSLILPDIPKDIDELTRKEILGMLQVIKSGSEREKRIKAAKVLILSRSSFIKKIWMFWHFGFLPYWVGTKFGQFFHTQSGLNIRINLIELDYTSLYEVLRDISTPIFNQDQYLLEQKFKYIKYGIFRLKGTGSYFSDLTFGEFRKAEEYFCQIHNNGWHEGVKGIISILYKPTWYSKRFAWKIIDSQPEEILTAIYLFYRGNQALLHEEFQNVFPKPKGKKGQIPDPDQYQKMWENIMAETAKTPDKYETIDQLPVRYVLKYLDREIQKAPQAT